MKKLIRLPIIVCFVMSVANFSCSKESPIPMPPPGPVATVAFKANGVPYEWDGPITSPYSSSITNRSDGTFFFYVSDPKNQMFNGLRITMQAKSLSAGTYSLPIDTTTTLENAPHVFTLAFSAQNPYAEAASTELGDYGTVTITNIHDGHYADGTFSAKLTIVTSDGVAGYKITIADGSFQNLTILE